MRILREGRRIALVVRSRIIETISRARRSPEGIETEYQVLREKKEYRPSSSKGEKKKEKTNL